MKIDIFTLFPQWFAWMSEARHLTNASEHGEFLVEAIDMRVTTPLTCGQVDDAPYGGGPGMVIRVDVVAAAFEARYGVAAERVRDTRRVVVLTPRGRPFTDALARELAEIPALTLLCGRYEGFDERVHTELANDEISLGSFVLAGGEIPAMAIVDATARRLPGALGNVESLDAESFSPSLGGRTEYPHFTRPQEFRGWEVPAILRSGNHGAVAKWREEQLGS